MENEPKPANKSFHENPDDHFDTEMRLRAVEGGIASHQTKIDDEDRLGIPAYDESVISDYIRNRKEMPADMVDRRGREIFKVETIKQPEGDYEKDLEKLKSLTPDELKKLLDEVEAKSKEEKGLFSKGNLLEGYAINVKTLESLHTTHHDAIDDLVGIIFDHLRFSDPPIILDDREIKRGIVGGFVYPQVPGFKTPIVKFFPFGVERVDSNVVSKENIRKIVNHIKQERKLLPISSNFRAL